MNELIEKRREDRIEENSVSDSERRLTGVRGGNGSKIESQE